MKKIITMEHTSNDHPLDEAHAAAAKEYEEKLLHPDWVLVEKHFGVPMPQDLKDYYANPAKVLQEDFYLDTPIEVEGKKRIRVCFFSKIDKHSTEWTSDSREGLEIFLDIASDGGEGCYLIDPKEPDPEVHLFILDTWDLLPTGLKLSEFLSNPRLEEDLEDYDSIL